MKTTNSCTPWATSPSKTSRPTSGIDSALVRGVWLRSRRLTTSTSSEGDTDHPVACELPPSCSVGLNEPGPCLVGARQYIYQHPHPLFGVRAPCRCCKPRMRLCHAPVGSFKRAFLAGSGAPKWDVDRRCPTTVQAGVTPTSGRHTVGRYIDPMIIVERRQQASQPRHCSRYVARLVDEHPHRLSCPAAETISPVLPTVDPRGARTVPKVVFSTWTISWAFFGIMFKSVEILGHL